MELAARQHGVVTRSQLLEAGVPAHVLEHRVARGRLRRLHRGVYRAGAVAAALEREVAAVLACGPGAHLTGVAAAALMELCPKPGADRPMTVLVPGGGHPASTSGILVLRTRSLPADESTTVRGIRTTSVARTILEVAATSATRETEQVLATALRERAFSEAAIRRLIDRYPRRRGTALLRRLLAEEGGPVFLRSEAEARFRELIERAKLPRPDVNRRVLGIEVDFHWPAARLIVEVDGYRFHRGGAAFERDRRRENDLVTAGYTVLRFTWDQLTRRPEQVIAQVAWSLGRSGVAPRR